jgi:metal-sulfur cluster biosynthetic enzyme
MLQKIKNFKNFKNKCKIWVPITIQIFYFLKNILDPEFPYKIYTLGIISFERILIKIFVFNKSFNFNILVIPTIEFCNMSSLILLFIYNKLNQKKLIKKLNKILPLNWTWKFFTEIPSYSHINAKHVSKQINDKERKAAAMENLGIRFIIRKSCKEF